LFTTIYSGLKFYNPGDTGFVTVQDVSRAVLGLMDSGIGNGERFVLVSDSLPYKVFFELLAKYLGVKAPSIAPPAVVTSMIGYLKEKIGNLTNKEPLLTRETLRTSRQKFHYDGSLITRSIDFQYGSLEKCIEETAKQFLKEHRNRH
jgi:dihydroflavonol-4-reductase